MRRLFIQFYLLLIGCFGLAILLIGLVYQVSAERAGDRYLERMMQGSLGLLTGELARLPPARPGSLEAALAGPRARRSDGAHHPGARRDGPGPAAARRTCAARRRSL